MPPKSRSLATYIERIHYGDHFCYGRERIFDYEFSHTSSLVIPGRINRILLYPGSFNPSHLSYLALLSHTFAESGGDLNIIAAIVLPLDDSSLTRKYDQVDTPIFTKEQRVSLWRKHHGRNDWYWIYNKSQHEWSIFNIF